MACMIMIRYDAVDFREMVRCYVGRESYVGREPWRYGVAGARLLRSALKERETGKPVSTLRPKYPGIHPPLLMEPGTSRQTQRYFALGSVAAVGKHFVVWSTTSCRNLIQISDERPGVGATSAIRSWTLFEKPGPLKALLKCFTVRNISSSHVTFSSCLSFTPTTVPSGCTDSIPWVAVKRTSSSRKYSLIASHPSRTLWNDSSSNPQAPCFFVCATKHQRK